MPTRPIDQTLVKARFENLRPGDTILLRRRPSDWVGDAKGNPNHPSRRKWIVTEVIVVSVDVPTRTIVTRPKSGEGRGTLRGRTDWFLPGEIGPDGRLRPTT